MLSNDCMCSVSLRWVALHCPGQVWLWGCVQHCSQLSHSLSQMEASCPRVSSASQQALFEGRRCCAAQCCVQWTCAPNVPIPLCHPMCCSQAFGLIKFLSFSRGLLHIPCTLRYRYAMHGMCWLLAPGRTPNGSLTDLQASPSSYKPTKCSLQLQLIATEQ